MPGFANDNANNSIMWSDNVDFSGNVIPGRALTTNGQLLIGSTLAPNIQPGILTSPDGSLTIGYASPNITLQVAGSGANIQRIALQTGTTPITPTAGLITFNGAVVAAGTNPVRTDGTGVSTMALEVQRSQAIAATNATNIGLAAFDSASFTVDANGFVQMIGAAAPILKIAVDTNTAPGTNPVLPSGTGTITVTGSQVAAGIIGANVIRTDSLAANTYTTQIQRSTAVAASASINNGVSHFDSSSFSVDANGFVQITSPVPNPLTTLSIVDDFIYWTGGPGGGENNWITVGTLPLAIAGHPGVYQLAGTTGFVQKSSTSTPFGIILGQGVLTLTWVMKMEAVANFTICAGLGDLIATGEPTNGVYFRGQNGVNSGNWQGKTSTAGTKSTANSGNIVDTNWIRLKMVINAAATSVAFFINDVQITGSPLTTNIPLTGITPFIATPGVNNADLDLFFMTYALTTSR